MILTYCKKKNYIRPKFSEGTGREAKKIYLYPYHMHVRLFWKKYAKETELSCYC